MQSSRFSPPFGVWSGDAALRTLQRQASGSLVLSVQALLFTDVVDSTLLTQRLGDARARSLWTLHDRGARAALRRHRGREIDRSDGFFLLFDRPADAARYALDYHALLATLEMTAKVGLHVGEVTLRDTPVEDVAQGAKRIEVEGLAKPVAARVMALARGGQTLLSEAARLAVHDTLDAALRIESHGHYRLKGVDETVEVFELGARDHCSFTPPHDTDKAYRVVRSGGLWRALREVRHNLPAERDAFIGRDTELRELARRLDGGTRALTLLGPAGTGKTRLVQRYGLGWLGDWPGGVYFCDLSEADSLDGIHFAVAVALDVRLGAGDAGLQLGHAIAGRGRCLMILDNFEQLVEHASATVGRWLDRAGDAAFVVTSRERLHLPGEEIFPVEPLPLDKEAIELFAARARAQRPDFVVGEANRDAVAEVVRLLDGLPLAIELAAARVQVLSPAQIVERMRDRFRLLAGAGGAAARQATLKAAIDWSWNLLAPWEQAALAQASVFEGGFTLAAAEAVFDLAAWADAPAAMDVVQSLVDKSLLRRWEPAAQGRYALDEPYFGMYLSIHEYAAASCRASGATAERAAQERHGRHFAGFGTDDAIEALSIHGGVMRLHALQLELDNLIAACRRAVARGDAPTAVANYRAAWAVLMLQGPITVGAALAAQVLAIAGIDDSLCEAVHLTQVQAAVGIGRVDEAQRWLEQALERARAAGDRHREVDVLDRLGYVSISQGRFEEARAHCEAAVAIHREPGLRRAEGQATANLAIAHQEQGRTTPAYDLYVAALAICREVGNRRLEGVILGNLANLHAYQGRFDEARSHYDQALAIHAELGNRRSEGMLRGNLGLLHAEHGLQKEAMALYEAALRIAREMGDRGHEIHVLVDAGHLLLEMGRIDEAASHYEQALVISRALSNHQMEGVALGKLGDLLLGQGRVAEAREKLREGEALLRGLGDALELATLLCVRGRADLAAGDGDAARRALVAAEATATAAAAGPKTLLSREVAKLRAALAPKA
jgi:predicted ATPase/class 3 adenylate cyclase